MQKKCNSTYVMAQTLLEVKVSLNEVLIELNIDSLLTGEWVQLYNNNRNLCVDQCAGATGFSRAHLFSLWPFD